MTYSIRPCTLLTLLALTLGMAGVTPSAMAHAPVVVIFPSGWGMYDLHGRASLPVNPAPAKKVGKQQDWNDLEILAQGNRVQVAVNGVPVIDWRDLEPNRIESGPIGLQLHSNKVPQEVRFKDPVIEPFPKEHPLLTAH